MTIKYLDSKRIVAKEADLAVVSNRGTVDTSSSAGNTIITFTGDGTFTPTSAFNVEYLVVAGGGGGGRSNGGGGGAGGLLTGTTSVTAQSYSVTVGDGGTGTLGTAYTGGNGANSVFTSFTAIGGSGGAGGAGGTIPTGGSGGGSGDAPVSGGSGTAGQGYAGGTTASQYNPYAASGGGGSGGVGQNANTGGSGVGGNGGVGLFNSITGTSVEYASGGGGATNGGTGGIGTGGGGNGAYSSSNNAVAGTDGTGSGGGGQNQGTVTDGGSGIVIIKFVTSGNTYDTSAGGKPTNVQDNSILVEKDTGNRYWRTPAVPYTDEDITWDSTTAVNVSISGNTATATGSTGWDKASQSTQTWTPSDEPTLEFTVTGSPLNQMMGFGKGTLGTSYTTLDYALYTESGLGVYESGVQKFADSSVTPSSSDTFKVTMDSNGLVKYWRNGSVFYTSLQTASGTYYAQFTPKTSASTTTMTYSSTTPATWTMEPTFEDDFSTDNFTDSGANVGISGGKMNFNIGRVTTNQSSYYDLGSALSDTKWIMRLHDVKVTTKSGGIEVFIGVSSNTSGGATAQDFIGLNLGDDTASPVLGGVDSDGAAITRLGGNYTYSLSTSYYVEIIRESATSYKINVFSDSGFSTSLFSQSYTCTATTTELQYVKFANAQVAGSTESLIGTCTKLEIYNGVTTIN